MCVVDMMRIKELRIERNKSQTEISSALGISRQVFANYEREINFPDPKMLIKIADYFDVSIDYLVGRADEFDVVDNTSLFGDNETELLNTFRQLDRLNQCRVLGYASALLVK